MHANCLIVPVMVAALEFAAETNLCFPLRLSLCAGLYSGIRKLLKMRRLSSAQPFFNALATHSGSQK